MNNFPINSIINSTTVVELADVRSLRNSRNFVEKVHYPDVTQLKILLELIQFQPEC